MARAVRISRPGGPKFPDRSDAEPSRFRPNAAALTRATRLFAIYLVALALIYAIFVDALWTSRAGFAGNLGSAAILLTGLAAVLMVWGFLITLARTPRGVELREHGFVLTEYLGRRRSFDERAEYDYQVENRYSAGWLAPAPTEMIRLGVPGRPPHRYLVTYRLIPGPSAGAGLGSDQ